MITLQWNIIVFAIITLIFIHWLSREEMDGFNFMPAFIILLYLIFLAVWGGVFWW